MLLIGTTGLGYTALRVIRDHCASYIFCFVGQIRKMEVLSIIHSSKTNESASVDI